MIGLRAAVSYRLDVEPALESGIELGHHAMSDRPDHDDWAVWQFIDFARVAGTNGRADLNLMKPEQR